jgi:hypothetical protein
MRVVKMLALAGIAGTLATATAADAQVASTLRLATMERTAGAPARAPLDDRTVDARLASADRAFKRGSLSRAKSMYEEIALEMRAENRLPTLPVWRLAGIEYAAGAPLKAAALLDALSAEAAAAGDATVEIMSLFEAGHIYALEGMSTESASRLDRGIRLLGGSDLPMETRVALLKKVRA